MISGRDSLINIGLSLSCLITGRFVLLYILVTIYLCKYMYLGWYLFQLDSKHRNVKFSIGLFYYNFVNKMVWTVISKHSLCLVPIFKINLISAWIICLSYESYHCPIRINEKRDKSSQLKWIFPSNCQIYFFNVRNICVLVCYVV